MRVRNTQRNIGYLLFPEHAEVKNYRVVADVTVDNTASSGDESVEESKYTINRIYFPNGGYVDMAEQSEVCSQIYEPCEYTDTQDRVWVLELTDKQAPSLSEAYPRKLSSQIFRPSDGHALRCRRED
ncbi:MAG: hypothetical protein ABFD64_07505 [Armatimonadota bacterium]